MYRVKKKKRVLVSVLCLLQILSLLAPSALAAQPMIQQEEAQSKSRYTRIDYFFVDISISSSGLANCMATVRSAQSTDTVKITIELQCQSGSAWSSLKSWNTSSSGSASIEKDWYVSANNTYRVYATAQVYNSTGVLQETAILTSYTVKY